MARLVPTDREIRSMSKEEAAARIEALRQEIRRHDYLYYVLDRPEISDEAYDRLFDALLRLEAAFPDLVTPDSPSQRVGGEPREELPTAEHTAPMLSLEATRDRDTVRRFVERIQRAGEGSARIVLEPKLDGASIELVYKDGALDRAVTRGNGRRGENVTANVKTIRSVPLRLRSNGRTPPRLLAVRGEVMMSVSAFAALNRKLLEEGAEAFANPRNAAAGSVRQLDPRVTAARQLDLVAYELMAVRGESFEADEEVLAAFREWGLRIPDRVEVVESLKGVLEYHEAFERERDTLEYAIDGIVLKADRLALRRKLGATTHHPRWALAYKFEPRGEITRVEDIVVQVGRTGVLTPVALLRPVEVGGVTVSRATLHNREEVRRRDIRIGDRVRIHRAGDVIPEVIERVVEPGRRRRPPFRMPNRCPACGTAVVVRGPTTYCPNVFGCPAQLRERLVHWGARDSLDIAGLGKETARELVDRKLVRELADLYRLQEEDLLSLPHFGEKAAAKLIRAIDTSRRVDLRRFLIGLGIPGVGAAGARVLAERFPDLEAIRRATREELRQTPGIGDAMADAVRHFFADPRRRAAIDRLLDQGIEIRVPKKPRKKSLAGRTFVFTGSLRRFTRAEAEEKVEELGGRASSSVSSRTDFLVAGEDPGEKLDEARRLGVRVLSEREFLARLRRAGATV